MGIEIPSAAHYPISNEWLNHFSNPATGGGKYVDIYEVAAHSASTPSTYLQDLQTNGWLRGSISQHISRAKAVCENAVLNGFFVGDAGAVAGRLIGDTFTGVWNLAGGIRHELRFTRIIAVGTDARNLKFLGIVSL